jgi:hypothetical protein
MYATVRRYLHVPAELLAELEGRGADMSAVLRSVPGLASYALMATREGIFWVMVCRDEASAMEVNRRAAAWLQAHIPGFGVEAPDVWAGPVTVAIPCDSMTSPTKFPAREGAKQ